MRKILLLLPMFMAISAATLYSQQNYESLKMPQLMPPSPEAFQLGSYGTVPVGLFTGSMNFSIPIYEIRTRNISVPLTLSYNSNGVKVDMPSSRVGEGWLLQGGGVINRTVYGKEDFVYTRREVPSNFNNPSTQLKDYLDGVVAGEDTQADIYSFNFNGYSGKFYFSRSGDIVTVPFQPNLRIIQNQGNLADWHFKLITPDGMSYFFGGSQAKERSKTQSGGSGCGYANYPFVENAWYLIKMIHPFGDSVVFKYNSVFFSYISNFSQSVEKLYPTVQSNYVCPRSGPTDTKTPPGTSISSCYTTITNEGRILSSIEFPDGVVKFTNARRFDLPGDSCVTAITIYSKQTGLAIKAFNFNQTFVLGNTSYNNSIVSDNGGSQRLFLNSITQLNPISSLIGTVHRFEYYDTADLAPRLSMAQDHFGYFNGASNSYFLPNTTDFSNLFDGYGGNRAPDFSYAKRGALKKIIYPTGGYNEIFYEQNSLEDEKVTYLKEGQPVVNNKIEVGGLRVAKIISYDPVANNTQTRKFLYTRWEDPTKSSGDLVFKPIYINDKIVHNNCTPIIDGHVSCGYAHFTMKVLHSNSIYPVYATTNGTVVYNEVRESLGENFENGGILHRYFAASDALAEVMRGTQIASGNTTNFGQLNGLEKETLFYSVVSGNVVKRREIINRYKNLNSVNASSAVFKTDTSIVINVIGIPNCPSEPISQDDLDLYDINRYFTFSQFTFNDTTFTYEYDADGQNPLMTISINRYDNLLNLQKTVQKTFTSTGDSLVTEFKYPYDFKSPGNVYQKMVDANFSAAIIETKQKKNTTVLDVIKTNYADWFSNNKILAPQTVELTHANFPAEVRLEYGSYSAKGELLEVSKKDDVKKSYIWSEISAFPVAEVTNSMATEIAYSSFEPDGAGNWTIPSSSRDATDAITGNKSYNLSNGNITKGSLNAAKQYIVSYWRKNSSPLTITGTQGTATQGRSVNGWTCFLHHITGVTTVTVSGSGLIDELRLYPGNAQMSTMTSDPLIGITSQCDFNNKIIYYEYDDLGRLKLMRDQDKNILKTLDYQFQVNTNQ